MIKVRTPRAEFYAASSNGDVYGEIVRAEVFPVYVGLGVEREYVPSSNDERTTEYRFFAACTVYVAEIKAFIYISGAEASCMYIHRESKSSFCVMKERKFQKFTNHKLRTYALTTNWRIQPSMELRGSLIKRLELH